MRLFKMSDVLLANKGSSGGDCNGNGYVSYVRFVIQADQMEDFDSQLPLVSALLRAL
jgi:hypothetical protein